LALAVWVSIYAIPQQLLQLILLEAQESSQFLSAGNDWYCKIDLGDL
jgi:hypothetical protein